MDYAIAHLTLDLQLQDLQVLIGEQHAVDMQPTDDSYAIALYRDELQRAITSISDWQLCRELGQVN